MRASIVAAVLGSLVNAGDKIPHPHDCRTVGGAKIAYGLRKDYDMGGCKCNDDTATWGVGNGMHGENMACYCNAPDQYESMEEFKYIKAADGTPTQDSVDKVSKVANKINDKNRK